jgi:hypothetical protein
MKPPTRICGGTVLSAKAAKPPHTASLRSERPHHLLTCSIVATKLAIDTFGLPVCR